MSYLPVNSVAQPVVQQVVASTLNSVTAQVVAPGATWSGTFESTRNVAGIQVMIATDQNGLLLVDQNISGVTPIVTDQFQVIISQGFSTTVQAVGSLFRVRWTNQGTVNATITVGTALCPVVDAVPRALDKYGYLKTGIKDIRSGDFDASAMVTPFQSLRTVESVRLVGAAFQGIVIDARYWTASLGTGGTVTNVSGGNPTGEASIATGTNANNTTSLATARLARYMAGHQHYFRAVVVLPAVTTTVGSNKRQFGPFDAANGYWFEAYQVQGASSPVLRLFSRNTLVDSAPITTFNGEYGPSYTLDNAVHTYEIYYTAKSIWFFIDGELLHTATGATSPLVGVESLPVGLWNINAGGNTANNILTVRVATINRLGHISSQPNYVYQSGITAGVTIKSGVGNLHKVIVGGITNNCVITLYDNTAASGTVIFAFSYSAGGGGGSANQPFTLDFGGILFSTGLTLVIATAAANVTVIYE